MSLFLSKEQIHYKLKEFDYYEDIDRLYYNFKKTYETTLNLSKYVEDDKTIDYLKEHKDQRINPLLWQFGHVVLFYIKFILKNLVYFDYLKFCEDIKEKYQKNIVQLETYYDSFLTPNHLRNKKSYLLSYEITYNLYNIVMSNIKQYMIDYDLNSIDTYLVKLGILHNEMHNEAFLFTSTYNRYIMNDFGLVKNKFDFTNDKIIELNDILKMEFIPVKGGIFKQGNHFGSGDFCFDNEMPPFMKKIGDFEISKHPITENMFLMFVELGGYKKSEYWSIVSYQWLKDNKITCPLYWEYDTEMDEYYKIVNGKKEILRTNCPMTNISYYEAKAFCKWAKVRLPIESEWEYCATNGDTTRFPWGDSEPDDQKANINYENSWSVSVKNYPEGDNALGISNLIGNVWEWCEEPIYPYDGFIIDPVYREMSFPFFGFKKICRGGSWAVPDFLITGKYRNAQAPTCRIQYIGFRVCKL